MSFSRRTFVARTAGMMAAGGTVLNGGTVTAGDETVVDDSSEPIFKVYPIGVVEKKGESTQIRISDKYADALLGLDQWSHVNVLYWFDKNDVPQKRRILRVHPRGDRNNPLTGVFACRVPVRPNLIALTVCKVVSVEENVLTVDKIDAFDSTPVIDLKPFIPPDAPRDGVSVPDWTGRKR